MSTTNKCILNLSIPKNEIFTAGISNLEHCRNTLIKVHNTLLILQKKGTARIKINFEDHFMEERSQILMLANGTISLIDSSEDFEIYYFGFRPSEMVDHGMRIDPNIFHFIKMNPYYRHNIVSYSILSSLFELIVKFYNEEDNINKTNIVASLIHVIFLDMEDKLKRYSKHKDWIYIKTSRHEDLFRKFMQLIHKNCHKHKEVSFYADELCITPRYLATIIKSITGNKTAKQIIDENVIAEIKFLLQSGKIPIKDIVTQMNFPDQSFLGKYFRKHTGMTLLEFRK